MMLLIFVLLFIGLLAVWLNYRHLALVIGVITLALAIYLFMYHMTDALNLQY